MKKYFFNYQTIIRFSSPVSRHSFLLRCLPCETAFQHVEAKNFYVSPCDYLSRDADCWGNLIQYGSRNDEHDSFVFVSCGEVLQDSYVIPASDPGPVFQVPSALTFPVKEMKELCPFSPSGPVSAMEKALASAHNVHEYMEYVPGSTSSSTSAAQAFALRKGVCQDYAHILLSLCRLQGIPARYVNGFVKGEGQTHAWVEVFDSGEWRGVDPTNDCPVDYGYIKLAHGRDASDCPVNRGSFMGTALQQAEIRVTVEEI